MSPAVTNGTAGTSPLINNGCGKLRPLQFSNSCATMSAWCGNSDTAVRFAYCTFEQHCVEILCQCPFPFRPIGVAARMQSLSVDQGLAKAAAHIHARFPNVARISDRRSPASLYHLCFTKAQHCKRLNILVGKHTGLIQQKACQNCTLLHPHTRRLHPQLPRTLLDMPPEATQPATQAPSLC